MVKIKIVSTLLCIEIATRLNTHVLYDWSGPDAEMELQGTSIILQKGLEIVYSGN